MIKAVIVGFRSYTKTYIEQYITKNHNKNA